MTIPPSLYSRVIYPVLVRCARKRVRKGLKRSKVFFPYFSVKVSYDDRRARERLAPSGISAPSIEDYLDRLIGYADRAAWGRTPLTRAQCAKADFPQPVSV